MHTTAESMFADAPPAPGTDKFSQATQRGHAIFTDQHGREWSTDIELKNQAPTGPMALRTSAAGMVAMPPLIPHRRYLRIHAAARRVWIDYDAWIEHLRQAHEDYEQNMLAEATRMYGEAATAAIAEKRPALLRVCGPRPEPVERVLAAKDGNAWVLGFDAEKPQWAERYWPRPVTVERQRFPTAAEERAGGQPASEAVKYPQHLGFGSYKLSDGTITPQKSKAYAQVAQAALDAGEVAPAFEDWQAEHGAPDEPDAETADVDPSWGS